jgi:hypothetical protein
MRSFNRVHGFVMTFSAGFLSDLKTMLGNADVVLEPTGGEVVRMPESIARFRHVLADELRRRVTVVADGGVAMTGFQPCAVLLVHHVAVCARRGIVGHVRIAARVNKRVGPNADGKSERNAEDDSLSKVKSSHDMIIRSRARKLHGFDGDGANAMANCVVGGSFQSISR